MTRGQLALACVVTSACTFTAIIFVSRFDKAEVIHEIRQMQQEQSSPVNAQTVTIKGETLAERVEAMKQFLSQQEVSE